MDVPLDLEDVEVVHGLDRVHVFVYHPDHVLEVVGLQNALLQLRPGRLDHIRLEVGPEVVDGQVHAPPRRTQLALEDLVLAQFVQVHGLPFLLLHPPRDLHEDLLHLNLYLSDGEEELVDPGEDLHEVGSEDEVDGPAHLEVQREIAPDVAVVVGGLGDHLPTLDLCLAVEVADVGDEAHVGPVHLKAEVVGGLHGADLEGVGVGLVVRVQRVYGDLDVLVVVVQTHQVDCLVQEVDLLEDMLVQLLTVLYLLFIFVLYRRQRLVIFLYLVVPVSDIDRDVLADLAETGRVFVQRRGDVLGVLDDEADHIGALVLFIVLPRLEDGLALLEAERVVDGEVVLHDLLGAVPNGSSRCREANELALDQVDVAHRTHVHEVLEPVELKPERLDFVVHTLGIF